MTVTVHEDLLTFMMSRSFRLRMRNVSDKSCIRMKTYFVCSVTFFWTSYSLWVNVEKCCRAGESTDDNITRRMCIACWISKATTNTHSEYAVLIAFPQSQWLHEWALMFTLYIHCLPCLLLMFGNRLLHTCSLQFLMATSRSHVNTAGARRVTMKQVPLLGVTVQAAWGPVWCTWILSVFIKGSVNSVHMLSFWMGEWYTVVSK